ncbi:hypothetical protein [Methanosarcina soligelidi]|uniref:hypothetical protein n=1 Tax=Methanosarcina soligelidi TaxID=1036677 RepID=UPI00064ED6B4|nr:hypothetical protein [Methanosarcina soligelidi]
MNAVPSKGKFPRNCNTDREKIVVFLKNCVIDKKLATDEVVYLLEEGKLEGVYSDEISTKTGTEERA